MANIVIHCCFISDNNYIVPTATAIQSLIESKKDSTKLCVHILAADLSDSNDKLFLGAARENVEIDVRKVSLDNLKSLQNTHKMGICMATPAALLKFSIAEIFTGIDRMLYLDGDMLIRKDLSNVFSIDLGDNIIAAVRDLGACWWQHAYVKKVQAYINTGFMLMDLAKMRNEEISQKLMATKRQLTDSMFMDQDVFNVVMNGRIKLLPLSYNASMPQMIWSYRRGSYDFKMLNAYYGCNYCNFKEIHDDTVVLHYSSKYKPWKFSNAPFGDEWLPVFQRSVAADINLNLAKGDDFYLGFAWYRWLNRNMPGRGMEEAVDHEYKLVADRGRRLEADMTKKVDDAVKKSCEALKCENQKLSVENSLVRGENSMLKAQLHDNMGNVPKRLLNDKLIISLTSYPARIGTIHKTIESIFCQTMKPDEVVLWLCREQFPKDYVFPRTLDYCFAKGLKVEWVDDNVKPHTKYLFAFRKYPEAVIVTFDDDSIYPPTRIAELYSSHLKFPNAVISARVHQMTFDEDGKIKSYAKWEKNSTAYVDRPMYSLCALGVGGVLYPPHCLPPEVDNVLAIKETCLCADDLWLKMMETLNEVPVVRSNSENLSEPLVDGTQDTALWKQNCGKSENDDQLRKVVEHCKHVRSGFDVLGFIFSHRKEGRLSIDEIPQSIPVRNLRDPQVSIIIPVHNVAQYLMKCVDSVLLAIHMSGLRVEVIFVDDESTDGTQRILMDCAAKNENFGVIFQLNGGAGVARNVGLEAARGEFVCFCDPDDWIDPLMIDKLYHKAVADVSDVVLCGRAIYDEKQKRFTGTSCYEALLIDRFPNGFTPDDVADKIFNAFYYVPWGKIIRRSMLIDYGIRFPSMSRNEDMSFANSVLVASRRISIVNEPLYIYRRNRVGSLQYGIEKTPYTQIEAARHTLKFLKATGMYERYRESFVKFVFMESVVRFRELSGSPLKQREFYERLRDDFISEFNLTLLPERILRLEMRKPLAILLAHGSYEEFLEVISSIGARGARKTQQNAEIAELKTQLAAKNEDIAWLKKRKAGEESEIKLLKAKLAARSKDIAWLKAKLAEKEE